MLTASHPQRDWRALPSVARIDSPLTRAGYALSGHAHLLLMLAGEAGLRAADGAEIARIEAPRLVWRVNRGGEELVAESGTRARLVTVPQIALLRAIPATPLGEEMRRMLGRNLTLPLDQPEPLLALVDQVAAERAGNEAGAEAALEHVLALLLLRLWRLMRADLVARPSAQRGLAEGFVILAARRAREHWRVEDYARALGVGREKLGAEVRRATGLSPKHYLQRELMREACELLANTNMPAGQVAFRLGFADPAYFTRAFSRQTGLSPGRYRQQARAERPSADISYAAWP